MTVWRLQLLTGENNTIHLGDYCLNNNVIAMGWSLENLSDSNRIEAAQDWAKYKKFAVATYGKRQRFSSVVRLKEDMKPNDLVWMRFKGIYYIARVKSTSDWKFVLDAQVTQMDACNQRTNINWYAASNNGDEDSVPGALTTAFIRGSALQRIIKPGVKEFSQMLFNHVCDPKIEEGFIYPTPQNMTLNSDYFYSLLNPSDVEDLLCMWLYHKYGYICIPSTNKLNTQLYECVLIDPKNQDGKHIYIQVKKGQVDIDANDYSQLPGDVYLLTTEGKVLNTNHPKIFVVDPAELFDFATLQDNKSLIPERIMRWVMYLSEADNAKAGIAEKGIMFDTNRTYSDTNEMEMLYSNKIAAYGDAKRYVNSFNKGDYALFYSKGRGIIAIGKVISDKAKANSDDELYQDVEMIVPSKPLGSVDEYKAISPSAIKHLLNRGFYFASTIKTPFLNSGQVNILITELKNKYTQ